MAIVTEESVTASGPIKVYILDDHEMIRRGIKELLEGENDIVVIGESGPRGVTTDPCAPTGRGNSRWPAAGRIGYRRLP